MLDFVLPMPSPNLYALDTIYNLRLLDEEVGIIVVTDKINNQLLEAKKNIKKLIVLESPNNASIGTLLSQAFGASEADYLFLLEPGYHIDQENFIDFKKKLLGSNGVNSLYICDCLDINSNKRIYNFEHVNIDLRELLLVSYASMFSLSGYVVNQKKIKLEMMTSLSPQIENMYPHIILRNQLILNGDHIVFSPNPVVRKSHLTDKYSMLSNIYSAKPLETILQISKEFYYFDQSLHNNLKIFTPPERVFSSLHVANHYRSKIATYLKSLKTYQHTKLEIVLEKSRAPARKHGFFSGGIIAKEFNEIILMDDDKFSLFYDGVLAQEKISVI